MAKEDFKAVYNIRNDTLHIVSPHFNGSEAESEEISPGIYVFFDKGNEKRNLVKIMIKGYRESLLNVVN